jgi:hypothetical protein
MIQVKGSVSNGILKVIAVVDGQVVGYQRPIGKRTTHTPAHVPHTVEVLDALDVPTFMHERTVAMHKAKRRARLFKHMK